MVHPLAACIEESWRQHRGGREVPERRSLQRRRSSLDCQASLVAVRASLHNIDDYDDDCYYERRYSLDHKASITTTFLADSSQSRPKQELDDSDHKRTASPLSSPKPLPLAKHSTVTTATAAETEYTGSTRRSNTTRGKYYDDGSQADDDDDSDCDSFCDASVEAPANKDYLRHTLGASCIFDDSFERLMIADAAAAVVADESTRRIDDDDDGDNRDTAMADAAAAQRFRSSSGNSLEATTRSSSQAREAPADREQALPKRRNRSFNKAIRVIVRQVRGKTSSS